MHVEVLTPRTRRAGFGLNGILDRLQFREGTMDQRRRTLVAGIASTAAVGSTVAQARNDIGAVWSGTTTYEGIPIGWIEPKDQKASTPVVIWLGGGISPYEANGPMLARLAREGYIAVSFDSVGRGKRMTESVESLFGRIWENWPRIAWPYLGVGALETQRVLDWATGKWGATSRFAVGGFSFGADIAVTAAGLDKSLTCVAAVSASPDWIRPDVKVNGKPVKDGSPDAMARYDYDHLNPVANLARYQHQPAITFECGEQDTHCPPERARRFVAALQGTYGPDTGRLRVSMHPSTGHEYTDAMATSCVAWFRRFVPTEV